MYPHARISAFLLVAASAAVLAGCAAPAATPVPPIETEVAAPVETTPEVETPAGGGSNDICALASDAEVAAVIGAAVVADDLVIGSLADDLGGQCVWTNDPAGDAYASGASGLELVVWAPDGFNPPPAEAPALGTVGVVNADTGAYFVSTDRVFWVHVTGAAASDPAAVTAAQALAGTIAGRVG